MWRSTGWWERGSWAAWPAGWKAGGRLWGPAATGCARLLPPTPVQEADRLSQLRTQQPDDFAGEVLEDVLDDVMDEVGAGRGGHTLGVGVGAGAGAWSGQLGRMTGAQQRVAWHARRSCLHKLARAVSQSWLPAPPCHAGGRPEPIGGRAPQPSAPACTQLSQPRTSSCSSISHTLSLSLGPLLSSQNSPLHRALYHLFVPAPAPGLPPPPCPF